jgi:hypothetical protein
MSKELIAGIILLGLGILFFFNNKNIGKGAYEFYSKFYTEKNLMIFFKIIGIVLFLGGLGLILIR